ncbi:MULTISPECIES: hypothetical protein [unclassified Paenibacillus]|nr:MULTISPECIES: hypothetical protein [unclassified Paenibacillus]MBP1156506.1 hypothetical protein [Paenibacillus sp. PvP091]MBP1168108.1 hypothetical protein [Paenibacillus sp. PvR098]MBP2439136.1 hypothetical protein [Paenibacillus sp. PvP052]
MLQLIRITYQIDSSEAMMGEFEQDNDVQKAVAENEDCPLDGVQSFQ